MKKSLFIGLVGALCAFASATLTGLPGHGYNNLTGIYQWDSGKFGSVSGFSTANPDVPASALSGANSPALAQIFDTQHRGLDSDTIVAVQFVFTDIAESLASYNCREYANCQTSPVGFTEIPVVGQTVTIGIWPGSVANGQQTRANALYLQDYVIQPEDVGIVNVFKTDCLSGCVCNLNDPNDSLSGYFPQTCGSCSEVCDSLIDCQTEFDPFCVNQGNGSNIRPFVAQYPEANFRDQLNIGCANHTRRADALPACCDPSLPTGATGACETFFNEQGSFSEYTAAFTTIVLNKGVRVSGEFWVGLLYSFPLNFPLVTPGDDLAIDLLGASPVNLAGGGPDGIVYTGINQVGTNTPLQLNKQIEINASNPEGLHPIAGSRTGIPADFLSSGSFTGFQDEFHCIRAVPKGACSALGSTCQPPVNATAN